MRMKKIQKTMETLFCGMFKVGKITAQASIPTKKDLEKRFVMRVDEDGRPRVDIVDDG